MRKFWLMPAALLTLTGCFGGKAVQREAIAQRRTYILEIDEPAPLTEKPRFVSAKMRSCRVMPPYDARNFVVRRDGGVTSADFYNTWLSSPAALVRDQTGKYLHGTRLFHHVYDSGAGTITPLGIEVVVDELWLDYTTTPAAACVRMRLLVLDERAPEFTVLFTAAHEVRQSFDVSERGASAYAFGRALSAALGEICGELRQAALPAP